MLLIDTPTVEVDGIYRELLRIPTLGLGIYQHAAGTDVPQNPHTEDEVYHVIEGMGRVRVGETDAEVASGTVVYVPAGVAHHFHSVTRDLRVLVFFAPAEYSRSAATD